MKKKNFFVRLRILKRSGVTKNYFKWLNDKETTKYLDVKKYDSIEHLKNYVNKIHKSDNEFLFGIYKNKKHVGNIKAKINFKENISELGYLIDKNFKNQGIATEAIRKIIFFVKRKNIGNILVAVNKKNISSSKVLLKNKFYKTNKTFHLKKRKGFDYYLLKC